MKRRAAAISVGVLGLCLALPGILFAQEAAPGTATTTTPTTEEPPTGSEPPTTPAPAAAPPESQPVTPAESEPAAPVVPASALPKAAATVSMVDFAFSPTSVTINVGDSVTWTNTGEEEHTATGSGFSTGTVGAGSSGAATFSTAGSFPYVCDFHPDMKGTITVSDPNATSGSDPSQDPGTDPSASGVDPVTGAPLATEAAAGAAPGAAGSADALPSTGQAEDSLIVIGFGLLACGLLAAVLARWRSHETELFRVS